VGLLAFLGASYGLCEDEVEGLQDFLIPVDDTLGDQVDEVLRFPRYYHCYSVHGTTAYYHKDNWFNVGFPLVNIFQLEGGQDDPLHLKELVAPFCKTQRLVDLGRCERHYKNSRPFKILSCESCGNRAWYIPQSILPLAKYANLDVKPADWDLTNRIDLKRTLEWGSMGSYSFFKPPHIANASLDRWMDSLLFLSDPSWDGTRHKLEAHFASFLEGLRTVNRTRKQTTEFQRSFSIYSKELVKHKGWLHGVETLDGSTIGAMCHSINKEYPYYCKLYYENCLPVSVSDTFVYVPPCFHDFKLFSDMRRL
jgi:hypothetical protein